VYLRTCYIVILWVVYYKHRRKCSRIEFRSVDGMEFYVCHGGSVNAWHNPKKGIYISDRLLEVLNRKELKAVYYHEKGHEKNVRIGQSLESYSRDLAISLFGSIFSGNLFVLLSGSISCRNIDISSVTIHYSLFSSSSMYALYLWFSEHEADIHSIKELGTAEPLVSALMKIHFYARLQREGVLLNRRIPSSPLTKLGFQNPGKKRIFKLILIESLKTASNVLDL